WQGFLARQAVQTMDLEEAAATVSGLVAVAEVPVQHALQAATLVALGRIALHAGDARLTATVSAAAERALDADAPEVRRHAASLLAMLAMASSDAAAARARLAAVSEAGRPSL